MADPVAESLLEYRKHFPALEECVHFISHSLGCVPAGATDDLMEFLDLWRTKSITAWGDWLPEVDRAAARISKIISAPDGTVIMHQNVSTIMSVLASCFEFAPAKNKVVYESLMFPTVSYVWQAEQRRGAQCVVVPPKDGMIDADAICAAIDERTLLVPLQHVVFATAQIQDVKKIVARAHEVGAHVILDCYQSIGTVPLDVVDLGVSFACGGSVKYLCGGAGAAWLYVRKDLIGQFSPRVTGCHGDPRREDARGNLQEWNSSQLRRCSDRYRLPSRLNSGDSGQRSGVTITRGARYAGEHSHAVDRFVARNRVLATEYRGYGPTCG